MKISKKSKGGLHLVLTNKEGKIKKEFKRERIPGKGVMTTVK